MNGRQRVHGEVSADRDSVTGRIADVVLVAFFGVLAWSLPYLPEYVVSHFGANGPDGWMPRGWFIALFAGTVGSLELLFRWGMPFLMRHTPPGLTNIPHRRYWMATPERQLQAYSMVLRLAGPSRLFFNTIMLLALLACVQASGTPTLLPLSNGWLGLIFGGGTIAYSTGVIVWAFTVFKPPAQARRSG